MWTGGCLCGAVRYKAEGPVLASAICHCRSCRKASSAPSLPFITFRTADVSFEGEVSRFRSSASVTRSFCGRCGSPLTYQNDAASDEIDLMACSLDDPDAFEPDHHVWTSHNPGWNRWADDLPAYPQSRPPGSA